MKTLLSGLADGTLSGLARRYAEWHVGGCPGCAAGLRALRALRTRLHALSARPLDTTSLPDERRAAVQKAWAEAERRRPEP